MSSIIKPLITSLVILIGVSLFINQTNVITDKWTNQEIDYALRIATQDATAVMMDAGFIFGVEEEASDFTVNLTKADKQFKSSFFKNIGSTIPPTMINEMSISLSGYAGYRYIYGVYGDGNSTLPLPYTYFDETNNLLYEFTLGDKIYRTNMNDGSEDILNINDLSEHFFHPEVTNKDFRSITVMSTINDFLNIFYADTANVNTMAINAGSGVSFNLGLVDYAIDDPTVMTQLSAVIDGPSFFAVVDCMDTEMTQMVRIMSLGAAELKQKDF